jgi:quinol monooxygenase YgiN
MGSNEEECNAFNSLGSDFNGVRGNAFCGGPAHGKASRPAVRGNALLRDHVCGPDSAHQRSGCSAPETIRKEAGNQTALALTQISRPNHLFLYEVWQNEDAFNKHESGAATREFRTKIQPMLGAPFDQRAHSRLE